MTANPAAHSLQLQKQESSIQKNLAVPEALQFQSLTVLATINPFRQQSAATIVEPGYALCFSRVFNNGWTDNRDVGQRPLEGFDFPNETEYLKPARRAQLVGVDDADGSWVGYEPRFDRSLGGAYWWPNQDSFTWIIRWYMNDRDNGYTDNFGTANMDLLITRL
jgi:hypothetical protein